MIVIKRGANSLRLFDGRRLVRTFRVATGQSVYPTPSGIFAIVDMQRNPWWYPPTRRGRGARSRSRRARATRSARAGWASTRRASASTARRDDASIGYSASHGCIRMHIPDAEWLFQHVHVGTPVLIQ